MQGLYNFLNQWLGLENLETPGYEKMEMVTLYIVHH